jgi:peptide/nickel transport system substrate-binding protein
MARARMNRRTFLKVAAGVTTHMSGGFAMPALAQGANARTIRFVPHADLANFDPIWGTANIVRNASALIYDTLYGFDVELQPQRQMVETEGVSQEGLTWTFRLRAGLKFHDGEPVLARDVVASLARWSARDGAGKLIRAIENELNAIDDRTFRWVLKKPYPKMLATLGKVSAPLAVIMPERIARTDPFRQITEYVGSGPMRFVTSERVAGARAVFEKFADYAPRQDPPSWLSGGKKMLVDRIEWLIMPDPGTAAAALQNGEIDWWEQPLADLVPCSSAIATSWSTSPTRLAMSALSG